MAVTCVIGLPSLHDLGMGGGVVLSEKSQKNSQHAGLLVCQDNDPDRDMSHAEIVRAIANLEQAGIVFQNCCHVLNAWRY
jgi:hypothetical protein